MRLTLRTLLAWLDDTLPPAEVRQIGHQVAESPFAQELVEKIHRVTRQRRLTVPNILGPDGTDPNLVAAYLDNELDTDTVAEYEKRCLTSDVHLAEVASVHQILSLIGQKAKVPPEARYRMYRMIKGREAVSPRAARAFSPPQPDPLTEPLVPWAPPEQPSRSWVERFGPPAFVCVLIMLLIWATFMGLRTGQQPEDGVALASAAPKPDMKKAEGPGQNQPGGAAAVAAADGDQTKAATPAGSAETAAPAVAKDSDRPAEKKKNESGSSGDESKPAAANADLPAGSVGLTDKSDAILLRVPAGSDSWERLKPESALKDDDRLVSLDHFRNNIQLGTVRVALVGEAEVRAQKPEQGLAAEFSWIRGRVVLYGGTPPAPIGVKVGDQLLKITPPSGVPVGLEAAAESDNGPGLRIAVSAGDVPLEAGKATEKLTGPGTIVYQASGGFSQADKKDPPAWVTEMSPSAVDKQHAEQFARAFRPDQSAMKSLLEALDDDQNPREVKESAIRTLGAIGQVDLVVPLLSRQGDHVSRQAAIRTLRWLKGQSAEQGRAVNENLRQFFGKALADTVTKLLDGYSSQEAREESTYSKLVLLLTAGDPAVRELAVDNLMTLTGRDDLGYDPDMAEGAGLKQWQDLLRRNELRPKAPVVTRPNAR